MRTRFRSCRSVWLLALWPSACVVLVGCASEEAARKGGSTVTERVTTRTTVTETAAAGSASAESKPETRDPKPALAFRGNGDRRLPPFRVPKAGTLLRWTNSGEVFSLFSEEGTLVDSVAARGETFLQRGVHRIDVVASGTWAISITRGRPVR